MYLLFTDTVTLQFQDFMVADKDIVQVYDGAERTQAIRLHPGQGFSSANPPSITLTADSGTMLLRFSSDPLRNAKGWSAKFSAGKNFILTTQWNENVIEVSPRYFLAAFIYFVV